jgi:hypothetical protein
MPAPMMMIDFSAKCAAQIDNGAGASKHGDACLFKPFIEEYRRI